MQSELHLLDFSDIVFLHYKFSLIVFKQLHSHWFFRIQANNSFPGSKYLCTQDVAPRRQADKRIFSNWNAFVSILCEEQMTFVEYLNSSIGSDAQQLEFRASIGKIASFFEGLVQTDTRKRAFFHIEQNISCMIPFSLPAYGCMLPPLTMVAY